MFKRVFSMVMTPAMVLTALVAPTLYFGNLVYQLWYGEIVAALLWFFLWGHILSIILAAIIVLPLLAVLALLAASAAWLAALAFGLQKRGIESLPFRVTGKDSEPIEKPDVDSPGP